MVNLPHPEVISSPHFCQSDCGRLLASSVVKRAETVQFRQSGIKIRPPALYPVACKSIYVFNVTKPNTTVWAVLFGYFFFQIFWQLFVFLLLDVSCALDRWWLIPGTRLCKLRVMYVNIVSRMIRGGVLTICEFWQPRKIANIILFFSSSTQNESGLSPRSIQSCFQLLQFSRGLVAGNHRHHSFDQSG